MDKKVKNTIESNMLQLILVPNFILNNSKFYSKIYTKMYFHYKIGKKSTTTIFIIFVLDVSNILSPKKYFDFLEQIYPKNMLNWTKYGNFGSTFYFFRKNIPKNPRSNIKYKKLTTLLNSTYWN